MEHTKSGNNSITMAVIALALLFLPVGSFRLTSIVLSILAIYEGNKVKDTDNLGKIGYFLGFIHIILLITIVLLSFILYAYFSDFF